MSALDQSPPRRSERINFRVDPEADELFREAAMLEGKSLSAFLLDAARERAERTIAEQRRIEVSAAEFARVLDELDRPAQVVAPLADLIDRLGRSAARR